VLVDAKACEAPARDGCSGWAVNSGGGRGRSLTQVDVERRTGVGGSGESGDGVKRVGIRNV
jgi:hypothetical protein